MSHSVFFKFQHFFVIFIFSLVLIGTHSSYSKESFKTLHSQELAELLKKSATQTAYLFDANSESTRKKDGFIPSATSLTSATNYSIKDELPTNKNAKLIFYCANEFCTASHSAAQRALEAGYTDVSVMVDGIQGWKNAGLATTAYSEKNSATTKNIAESKSGVPGKPANTSSSGQAVDPRAAYALVAKGNAIIVDVRETKERSQVIASALSLPMSDFQDPQKRANFFNQIPKNKKIIFHCAAGFRAQAAAKTISQEGFQSAFFEGPDQWAAAGLPLAKGPVNK